MSAPILCIDCSSFVDFREIGISKDFDNLTNFFKSKIRKFRDTETIGYPLDEALIALENVFNDYSLQNWDGYDALPVKEEACNEAQIFLAKLPSFIPMPDIVPEPDGAVGLEWSINRGHVLVVSLSGTNRIDYACVSGPNRRHGSLLFGRTIPREILERIQIGT